MAQITENVKGRRRYDATGRQAGARQTRARVLEVARDRFLNDGYSATTVPAVARAAGISPQAIYKIFGNKVGLIKAIFDVAIAGDDEPVPVPQRPALVDVSRQTDPYKKLELYAQFVADTAPRHVPVQLLIQSAAATHPDAQELWDRLSAERLTGMTMFAQYLAPHLRKDVTIEEARDVLWAYNSAELWDLLVGQRGWSAQRYAVHLARTLAHALLPSTTGPGNSE
ncbi:TetR/AcrR family transcriptional regulator [Nakamurella sp. GG22]